MTNEGLSFAKRIALNPPQRIQTDESDSESEKNSEDADVDLRAWTEDDDAKYVFY